MHACRACVRARSILGANIYVLRILVFEVLDARLGYFYSTRLIAPYFRRAILSSCDRDPVDASRIHLFYALEISRNGEGEREFVLRTNPASAFEFRRLSVRLSRFLRARAGPHNWMRRGERSGAREKRSKNPRIPRARGADACGARRGVTHRGGFASIASRRIASHHIASRCIAARHIAKVDARLVLRVVTACIYDSGGIVAPLR